MASSYFVTFGNNRVTYPGATGSVAWEATDPPKILVEELYKNPTSGVVASIPLSKPLSAFDYVQIHAGWTSAGYSQQVFTVAPDNTVNVVLPLVDGAFRYWCMAQYTGGNTTTLTRQYISNWQMYSRGLTTATSVSLCIYGISGVKNV